MPHGRAINSYLVSSLAPSSDARSRSGLQASRKSLKSERRPHLTPAGDISAEVAALLPTRMSLKRWATLQMQ